MSIIKTIHTDFMRNSKASFVVLFFYRIQHHLYSHNSKYILRIVGVAKSLSFFFLRLDAQIHYKAIIGYNIRLPHRAMGVVISPKAIIGNNITIYHQVTIGVKEGIPHEQQQIIIKDNCYISVGAKIISCVISEGSKIGPNAVVYKNIPPYSLVISLNEIKVSKK